MVKKLSSLGAIHTNTSASRRNNRIDAAVGQLGINLITVKSDLITVKSDLNTYFATDVTGVFRCSCI
jgi:hypothetical protein